jgi:hypothetical protein
MEENWKAAQQAVRGQLYLKNSASNLPMTKA